MSKAVINIISAISGAMAGSGAAFSIMNKRFQAEKALSQKHLKMFLLMNQWVKLKQEEKKLSRYLAEEGYMSIAVYGMSYVGQTLLNELKESEVNVVYGIDKSADRIYADIRIYTPDEELPKVDAVIVTAINFFDEIEAHLVKKLDCPIISLEDIVNRI